jgi:hypothetical protein
MKRQACDCTLPKGEEFFARIYARVEPETIAFAAWWMAARTKQCISAPQHSGRFGGAVLRIRFTGFREISSFY